MTVAATKPSLETMEDILRRLELSDSMVDGLKKSEINDFKAQIADVETRLAGLDLSEIEIDPMKSSYKAVAAARVKQTDLIIGWLRDVISTAELAISVLNLSASKFADAYDKSEAAIEKAKQTAEKGLRMAGLSEIIGGQCGVDASGNLTVAARSFEFAINNAPVVTLAMRDRDNHKHAQTGVTHRISELETLIGNIKNQISALMAT